MKLPGPGGLRGRSQRSILGPISPSLLPTLGSGPHRGELASPAVGIGTPGGLCTPPGAMQRGGVGPGTLFL